MNPTNRSRCCLCGAQKPAYHNPDPLRDGTGENCCDECNQLLVRPFRQRVWKLPEKIMQAEILRLRRLSYEELKEELTQNRASVYLAPNATVVGDVTLGQNVNIWYGAVLRGDHGSISVGEGTNIQDNAVIHDATVIGKHCTVGHGAIVHGARVADGCLIGMGSIVLDGAVLEEDCLVGACAVVTGKVHAPAGSVLLGNPARIVRQLTAEQRLTQRGNATHYVELAKETFG